MQILVINPNSSLEVTQSIDQSLTALRIPGGPELSVERLEDGPGGIASQIDADSVVLPLVRRVRESGADAFVIACFSDPGIHAVREAANGRPVHGIAECGIAHALTRGDRFGIIALSDASARRQMRYVRQMSLYERFAGSWPVQASAADTAGSDILPRLIDAGRQVIEQRGADVVILGCPVVEPVQQAALTAIGRLICP
jgi:allantoin racemase